MPEGLTFSEVMRGRLVDGEHDPTRLTEAQLALGHPVTLNATIVINDLERFIADRAHLGELSGGVEYAPLQPASAGSAGVFNLFSPGADAREKLMVYELAFRSSNEDYYFAGRKIVRDDPGMDLWPDTTTLFTQIHRGTNKSGDVIGSGVLNLQARNLIELMSTIEVTGTDSATGKARVIAEFGGFFAGELWDTYGLEVLRSHADD